MAGRFLFIGVTTGSSSIGRIFPIWREALGLGDAALEGWDLPVGAGSARYRETVDRLRTEAGIVGGLVTTHKIAVYEAARDRFDWVDPFAELCGEISCFARRGGQLLGWAMDPISSGKALTDVLGADYFGRTGGEALLFGAGGASVAISLHLLSQQALEDRPRRLVVTDRSAARLEHMRALHRRLDAPVEVAYALSGDPQAGDRLVASLPVGSLVVNATGMGKDTPGSPLTGDALFPEAAIAWELNYRGDLPFLHQAWAQRDTRAVRVEDGWRYFIHGWTTVIEEVFEHPLAADEVQRLSELAQFARPPLPTWSA